MQIYLIYGVLFISVVLLVEAGFLFLRTRLSGEDSANKRIRMIEKTGDDGIGIELIKARQTKSASYLVGKFENELWAANLQVPIPVLMLLCGMVSLVSLFGLQLAAFPLGMSLLIAVLIGFALPYIYIRRKAAARRKLFEEQLIPSIDLVSRGLQAGHPAAVALEIVAKEMPDPIGTEFGLAIDQMAFGMERDAAMRTIAEKFPSPEMSFFSSALEIQRETGGNLVEVLNNLTTMMRDARAMRKKVQAISSEGRITALVVGVAPFIMIGILTVASPGYFSENFDNPTFFLLMGIPFVFYLIGMFLIRRLINIRI